MVWATIRDVGSVGLVSDRPGHEIPPEAWSRVENVRFSRRFAGRAYGDAAIKGTRTGTPYFLLPTIDNGNSPVWAYGTLTDWYVADAGGDEEITRASGPYTGTVDDKWNGGWLNGVVALTNGVDDPQIWNPISSGQRLVDMPNWPAGDKIRILRPLRNYLVGFDVTKSGTRYPSLVKWSDITLPGNAPPSWDETDPATQAGELPISQTPGAILDAIPFRNELMVLKRNSMTLMYFVGGNEIFNLDTQAASVGALSQNCAVELFPGQIVMLTNEFDVVLTDGRTVESVAYQRVLRELQDNINEEYQSRAFLTVDWRFDSLLVCYPEGTDTIPRTALVWNWRLNTWSKQSIPQCFSAMSGRDVDATGGPLLGERTVFGDVENDELRRFGDSKSDIGGSSYNTVFERRGLAIIGADRGGNPRADVTRVKLLTGVKPLIETPSAFNMDVYVGATEEVNGEVFWEGPYRFNPVEHEYVDVLVEGTFVAVRFETDSTIDWKLHGYAIDVADVGERF